MADDLRFTIEIDGIQKTITSLSEANKVIRDLTKNFVLTKEAGRDLTTVVSQLNKALEVKSSLKAVSLGAVELGRNMQGAQTASANASMALLNLNYVIRDSPYFFNNFAMGVLAVGNNLNPLIDSFNRLRTEAVGKNISTFALLKQALVGGAGISIAFSVVVTAIQSFVFWQSRADRETESANKSIDEQIEKIGKLRYEYNQLLKDREQRMVGNEDTSLERLTFLRNQERAKRNQIRVTERDLRIGGLTTNERFVLGTNLGVYKNELAGIQKEINFILFAWNKVYEEENKNNKALKEQKTILEDLAAQEAKLIKIRRGNQLFEGAGIFNRQDIRNFRGDSPDGLSRPSNKSTKNRAFGFGGETKELNMDLEMGKIAAQQLGDTLASAFDGAKIKLGEFIQSLGVAIAKMLLLKVITAALTGGTGGATAMPLGASMPLPSIGNPNLGKTSGGAPIKVSGRITTSKNNIVAIIENATNYYNNNEKLVLIGR